MRDDVTYAPVQQQGQMGTAYSETREGEELHRPSLVTKGQRASAPLPPQHTSGVNPHPRSPLMLTTWHLPFGGLTLARPPQAPFM